MRVWERGSGETWACGTGACAAAVAAVLNGYCERDRDIAVQRVDDAHIEGDRRPLARPHVGSAPDAARVAVEIEGSERRRRRVDGRRARAEALFDHQ